MTKRYINTFLVVGIAVIILVIISWIIFPQWKSTPGGLWSLIVAALTGVLTTAKGLKDVYDLLNIDQEKGRQTQIVNRDNARNVQISGGTYFENVEVNPRSEYPSALHQLPEPPPDFVGRKNEIQLLLDQLTKGQGIAISGLSGMAGIGKTALGLAIAHRLKATYSDAQLFIDLKGTGHHPLQASDVMKFVIYSFNPSADLTNISEAYLQAVYQSTLSGKKVLLFLDNAHDASHITPLLPPSSCCLIITSRWRLALPGLQSLRLDVFETKDALEFLMSLCSRIDKHAEKIADLCGYLPIALRMAGTFLQTHDDWPITNYIEKLSDKPMRLQSLQIEVSDSPIEAAFEMSFQQLDKDERRYWSMLTIFPAPCTRMALTAVLGLKEATAQKIISKLVEYSLLDYDSTTDHYHMHDLLSDFANSKMLAKDKEKAQINYIKYYWGILSKIEELYGKGGDESVRGLEIFNLEWRHIITAYYWASNSLDKNPEICKILKEVPESVYLLRLRLNAKEQIQWFGNSLKAARKLGDRYNESKLLGNIGVAYYYQGEVHMAIQYFESALAIASQIGDQQHQGFWLGNLASMYGELGRFDDAIGYYEKALSIARDAGDRMRECFWLGNIGTDIYNQGYFLRAIEYLEKALFITRELGVRQIEGVTLGNIGVAVVDLGEPLRAIGYFEQALAIARDIGDIRAESGWLVEIGEAYMALNKYPNASEYLEKSLIIARELEDKQYEGKCLGKMGKIYHKLNDATRAVEFSEKALTIAVEIDDRKRQTEWLRQLGEIYTSLHRFDEAVEYLNKSIDVARKSGFRFDEGKTIYYLAIAYLKNNDKKLAMKYSMEAREILSTLDSPVLKLIDQLIDDIKN